MFPTELSALYNKLTVGMCLICQEIKQDQQQNLFFIHPGDFPESVLTTGLLTNRSRQSAS